MSNPHPLPRRGQYAKWRNRWHRVMWAGPVSDGRPMVCLVPWPREGGAQPFYVSPDRIEVVSETDPHHLDVELDRRLSRDD